MSRNLSIFLLAVASPVPVIALAQADAVPANSASSEAAVRQTVTELYESYKLPLGESEARASPFSRRMDALIENTEMGFLEYDPFCQCQDYDETKFSYKIQSVSVQGERADVGMWVKPVGGSESSTITLNLLFEDGRWAVDDVVSEYGSLSNELVEP